MRFVYSRTYKSTSIGIGEVVQCKNEYKSVRDQAEMGYFTGSENPLLTSLYFYIYIYIKKNTLLCPSEKGKDMICSVKMKHCNMQCKNVCYIVKTTKFVLVLIFFCYQSDFDKKIWSIHIKSLMVVLVRVSFSATVFLYLGQRMMMYR